MSAFDAFAIAGLNARRKAEDNLMGHRVQRVENLAEDGRSRLSRIEHDVQRLTLICEGLWRLLKEKHGYSDEELITKVIDADLSDGRLDNKKAQSPPKPCPRCHRNLNRYHPVCLYCGEILTPSLFD